VERRAAAKTERERQGPSNRNRFVARAKTLAKDKTFREETERVRTLWNKERPGYPLNAKTWFPTSDTSDLPVGGGLFYPPDLRDALEADDERWADKKWWPSRADRERRWKLGHTEHLWRALVVSLASEVFPIDDFPHHLRQHPASLFVSLCVAFEPSSVPTSSVYAYSLEPQWAPAHPNDIEAFDAYLALRAKADALSSGLRQVAEGGAALSPAGAERLIRDGARAEASVSWSQRRDRASGFWFVPIVPELTARDWRDAEADALAASHARFGESVVAERIRHWRGEGLSNRAIAAKLGVTPPTVANHLKGSKT